MKQLPDDPLAMQARVMRAMCDDLFDLGAGKARRFDRLNALHEIHKQERGRNNG